MKIPLTLNGEKMLLDAEPAESLLSILRKRELYSVKCGCQKGHCGNCMVLLDEEPVPSCIIPIGTIREKSIVTLEYFKKNYPEYKDISDGFSQAGIHLCGYCNAGKILTAYNILRKYHRPEKAQIISAVKSLDFCCTDRDSLVNGIGYSVAARHIRLGSGTNAKK